MARYAKPRSLGKFISQILAVTMLLPTMLIVQSAPQEAMASGGPVDLGAQLCRSVDGTGDSKEADKNKNGFYTSAAGRTGETLTGLRIDPLFGKRMYVDPGRNFDATYIAYRITNNTGASQENLTVALSGFAGTVIRPVSSDDNSRFIGTLTNGASRTVYFMLRATGTTSSDQTHQVRIFRGNSSSGTQLAGCNTNIEGVQRSLSASANKVTSISVNGSPALGSTFTVTVNGAPGKVGQGNDIDGSIMAISPASNSSWPTKAIRLEGVSLELRGVSNANQILTACQASGATMSGSGNTRTATFTERLVIRAFGGCANNTKQTYTATYTFRVVGFAASDPAIVPLASIGSGTQVKYTGSLPSASASVPLTATSNPLSVSKSFVSSTVSGNDVDLTYRVTVDSSATASLQEVRDLPSAGMDFQSATYTDALRTNQSISKVDVTVGGQTYWSFQAPFSVTASTDLVLTYVVRVQKPSSGTQMFSNEAFALFGDTVVGSGANVTGVAATVSADGTVSSEPTTRVADKTPQEISLDTPTNMGNNSSITVAPTSDSGLPVTLTSTTPNTCVVSEFNGVWTISAIAEGTCTIEASQQGNDRFAVAPVQTRNITVLKGQAITHTATSFSGTSAGSTASLTVSATSKLEVSIISIDVEICTAAITTPYNASTGETVLTITTGSVTGACILQASQAGGGEWGPAPNRDITLGVGTPQVIDFSSPADGASFSFTNGLNFNAVATAKTPTVSGSNTNNPVSFASSTPLVCTVRQLVSGETISSGLASDGRTTVPIDVVNPGSCVITASQDGLNDEGNSSTFAAAPDVTKTFTITGSGSTPQNIVFDAVAGKAYGDANFVAFATSRNSDQTNTGLLVTITSITPTICSVSSSVLDTGKSKVTVALLSAGDCILQGAQAGTATYQAAANQTLTIAVATKELTLSGLTATKIYDGTDSVTFGGSVAVSGIVPGDDQSRIAVTGTPAGTYPDENVGGSKNITVTGLSLTGTKAASYTIAAFQVTGSITQRPITIAFNDSTVAASANVVCLSNVSVTSGSLVRSGSISAVSCAGIPANGSDNDPATLMSNGPATVTPSAATISEDVAGTATDTSANYLITYVAGTLTVSAKQIPTLETENIEVLYGTLLGELETTADTQNNANKTKAKVNGNTIPGSLSHKKNGQVISGELDAGTHTVIIEFTPTDTTTYEVTSTQRTITVNKRQLRVSGLSVTSKEYDGTRTANVSGTATLEPNISGHDVLAGDQAQVSLSGSASGDFADENVGSGIAVGLNGLALAGAKSGNYQLVSQNLTGSITKRPITFQAQTRSKLFGATDPSFGFTVAAGSFATGENASTIGGVGAARVSGESVGEYVVNISVQPDIPGTPRANYNISIQSGKLFIAKPTLAVTESAGVITDNTVTCSCEGFKPGATVTVTMFSTPTVLDSATVANDGTCPDLVATIPDGTDGTHTLEIESLFPNDDPLTYSINFTAQPTQNQGSGGGTPPPAVILPPAPGPTPEVTPTPTPSPSPTPTVSPSPAPSPTLTPGPVPSPTITPAPRPTPTQAPRPTITPQPTASATPSATQTPRPTATPTQTSAAPLETQQAAPPRVQDRIVGDGLTSWFGSVAAPSESVAPGGNENSNTAPAPQAQVQYDTGGEVQFTESGAVDLRTVKRVSSQELANERISGFIPGSSMFIEVLGSRTGARFVATTASLLDSVTLIEAIRASIPAQAADFFEVSVARVGSEPTKPEPWTEREKLVAYDYFQASGLDLPVSLADFEFSDFTSWIEIEGSADGYVVGSTVFLTLTSTPLVIAEGVVDRNGRIEIKGNIPVQFLEPGEHRVRLVGIRSIGGVSVDEQGEIVLSDQTMQEIERFDLGTQATIRFGGKTPEGDYLNAIRVVPLVPVAPWWTLWFILAGFLVAIVARRRHWTNTRAKLVAGAALNIGAALPAVILGWLSTVTLVTWVGLALGAIATLVTLVVQPSEKAEERRG